MFEITEKNQKNELEMNGSLKKVTEKINHFQNIAKNSIFAISLILADIAEKPKNYLENSGFATIADYTEEVFGYKKAYTYKMIKISKFINITDKNGEHLSVDYLLDDNKAFELTQSDNYVKINVLKDADGFDYSPSQMLEIIPLTSEQITDNLKDLDSSFSCKELRKIVKDIVNPPVIADATITDTEGSTESTEETTSETTVELTDKDRILQMLEITASLQNEEIKEKIVNVFQKSLKVLEK